MASFNLVDEPWILVNDHQGRPAEVGLRELFVRAHEFVEIVESSPLCIAGELRLLIALAHRIVDGPIDDKSWERVWHAGRFDSQQVDGYLRKWENRFNLFSPSHPFYQSRMGAETSEISKLTFELPSTGNGALLFGHEVGLSLSPAEAARQLLAHQVFALGGTMSYWPGHPETLTGNKDAPSARYAQVFLSGRNLFETITLNLMEYDPCAAGERLGRAPGDCPSWERSEPIRERCFRPPSGWLDLLTWQSRAIELLPCENSQGETVVDRVAILGGNGLSPGLELSDTVEAFIGYQKRRIQVTGQSEYIPLALRLERVVWRDSLTLIASEASKAHVKRPGIVAAMARRRRYLDGDYSQVAPLEIIGMVTESGQSKVHLWRHERLPIPQALLDDRYIEDLSEALAQADQVGRLLSDPYWIWSPFAHKTPEGKADKDDAKKLATRCSSDETYWASLDTAFRALLFGVTDDAEAALTVWRSDLIKAARRAFANSLSAFLGQGQYALACAEAERNFEYQLGVRTSTNAEGETP